MTEDLRSLKRQGNFHVIRKEQKEEEKEGISPVPKGGSREEGKVPTSLWKSPYQRGDQPGQMGNFRA